MLTEFGVKDWTQLRNDNQGLDFNGIRQQAIPKDLKGKSVLDVGGYSGHLSVLAKERGATDITIVDNRQWEKYDGWTEPNYAHIPWAKYVEDDIMNYKTPADLVICYNVIYHVTSPWDLCVKLRSLTKWRMSLCTSFVPGTEPVWKVLGREHSHKRDVVYWKPTLAGLWELLELTGFEVEGVGRAGDHVTVICI